MRAPTSFDELEIHTADGAALRALVVEPPDGASLRGTLVLAHALLARKTSFGRPDRPGLAHALAARGFRTVAFDFRGHGDSAASDWGYDDLVRSDIPAVVECARARSEDMPVIVVGHSLGAHVTLAAQGTGRVSADAVVALAGGVWVAELEPSRARWAVKKLAARATLAISNRVGGIPARRLRIGSDDASRQAFGDVLRGVTTGRWTSADGTEDYLASLPRVTVPVAAVVGDRDHLICHPAAGEAFARRCSGDVRVFHTPVSHMEIVTSARARATVIDAVEWALARVSGPSVDRDRGAAHVT